ncbi:hypothetical protein ACWCYK_01955 [Streptomyces lydicamycinicus]|uniref:hypothetical protein n=1 Tax=Streptomyces lydicamycinicus TaxID=1546107 RepID=UPI003C2F7D25
MSFPPPPPNQPNQPPNATPGGFGPPAGGYGPGGQGQGGYGPGGYGTPPGGQAPGGYGPPAGGYGPPGPGGPGGWQQPPGPPDGGGNGKTIAAIIGGGVIVLAAVITIFVVANSDDSGNHRAQPSGSSTSATPSESASPTPYDDPTPTATPTGSDFEKSLPTPSNGKIPFYLLKVGDCYDRPADGGGNNDEASCNGPHDAEVVATHRLDSGLTTESGIQNKAASLCRNELERKAAQQPSGTAEGTYVQYPSLSGYRLGIKTISCSLTGNRSLTKKLTKPLS